MKHIYSLHLRILLTPVLSGTCAYVLETPFSYSARLSDEEILALVHDHILSECAHNCFRYRVPLPCIVTTWRDALLDEVVATDSGLIYKGARAVTLSVETVSNK